MTSITTTLQPQLGTAKGAHAPGHAAKAGGSIDFLSLGAIEAPEIAGQTDATPAAKVGAKTVSTDMAALLAPEAATPDLPSDMPVVGERHHSAEDGKDLPQGDAEADASDDGSPEAQMEAAIAWLMPTPTPEPVVAKPEAVASIAVAPKVAVAAPVVTVPAVAKADATPQPVQAQAQAAPTPVEQAQAQVPVPQATNAPQPAPVSLQAAPAPEAKPVVILQQQAAAPTAIATPAPAEPRLREACATAPVQPIAASPVQSTKPGLTEFPTHATEQATTPAPRRRIAEAITGADLRATAQVEAPRIAVTQTADAQNGTLDMSRQDWPSKMVDHIERLRDDADANDTRIRLVPDQLGQVDVSIRQDGDTLHLHFATETQDAANLIQDAQPVLADMAESRGLRLGQSSVDAGNASTSGFAGRQQDSQAQNQAQAQPNPNRFTRPAPAQADNDDQNPTDTRIA